MVQRGGLRQGADLTAAELSVLTRTHGTGLFGSEGMQNVFDEIAFALYHRWHGREKDSHEHMCTP